MPSAREVIIDHVPSVGWVVTTANWSTLRGHASKSSVLEFFGIFFYWIFGPTFFQANAVKTESVLHLIVDRETAGLTLWVQCKILWVNAIFVCKFDSFPKSVLSSNWPVKPCYSNPINNGVAVTGFHCIFFCDNSNIGERTELDMYIKAVVYF